MIIILHELALLKQAFLYSDFVTSSFLKVFTNVFDRTLLNFGGNTLNLKFLIIIFEAFSADSKQHNFMQKCYFRSDKNSATI